jgi:hypothetical protein
MSLTIAESPDVLEDGAWIKRGHIVVWVPAAPPPRKVDLSTLVACPTCRARVVQSCRTKSGHTTAAHANRLVQRRCGCGRDLPGQRRYCDECRDERNRMSKRAWSQRQARATTTRKDAVA